MSHPIYLVDLMTVTNRDSLPFIELYERQNIRNLQSCGEQVELKQYSSIDNLADRI